MNVVCEFKYIVKFIVLILFGMWYMLGLKFIYLEWSFFFFIKILMISKIMIVM